MSSDSAFSVQWRRELRQVSQRLEQTVASLSRAQELLAGREDAAAPRTGASASEMLHCCLALEVALDDSVRWCNRLVRQVGCVSEGRAATNDK